MLRGGGDGGAVAVGDEKVLPRVGFTPWLLVVGVHHIEQFLLVGINIDGSGVVDEHNMPESLDTDVEKDLTVVDERHENNCEVVGLASGESSHVAGDMIQLGHDQKLHWRLVSFLSVVDNINDDGLAGLLVDLLPTTATDQGGGGLAKGDGFKRTLRNASGHKLRSAEGLALLQNGLGVFDAILGQELLVGETGTRNGLYIKQKNKWTKIT